MKSKDRFITLPPFQAPWWLKGGHRQTLAATWWTGDLAPYTAVRRQVLLDDGDIVVVHDDRPPGWKSGDPAALLMHGLISSHQSPLLVRLASKLTSRGIRVFRLDLRGAGAGDGLAKLPYNAGCSHDLSEVIGSVIQWCRDDVPAGHRFSPAPFLSLFGVSLSGNVVLKYVGERADRIPREIQQVIAVNPPIDLNRSLTALRGALNGVYDRHFARQLFRDVLRRRETRPDAPFPKTWDVPRGVLEFDDWYTAPVCGYLSARDYYNRCSAQQFMKRIQVPTTIITSCDDPMVPSQIFTDDEPSWSPQVRLAIVSGGGHVGYFAKRLNDPDEFWLDWRIVELISEAKSIRPALAI